MRVFCVGCSFTCLPLFIVVSGGGLDMFTDIKFLLRTMRIIGFTLPAIYMRSWGSWGIK